MLSPLRPRLASLEAFSGALLLALGLAPAGCESEVLRDDGGGGSGGSSGAAPVGPGVTSGPSTAAGGTSGGTTATGNGSAGGTGGGSNSVAASAGSSTGASSTGGGTTGACVDPQPILRDGVDTGLDQCAGGQLRRRAAVACEAAQPGDETCCGSCPEGFICNTQGEVACNCVEACKTDGDCGDGSLCMCGEFGGTCAPAGCQTSDDCEAGQECTSWDTSLGCLYLAFVCTTAADTCGGPLDCGGQHCAVVEDGHRACVDGGCAIGRPFLVLGEARTAPLAARADWLDASASPRAIEDGAMRALVAAAWEDIARMEHASIAAFARFSLQLLALGAPAELLERTHRALADETRHARLAFHMASTHRGAPVGPGLLRLEGALDGHLLDGQVDGQVDGRLGAIATFVRLLVREGCVGETVASLEAAECMATAEDPVVRALLATIAADEAEHAELAWRTARWMIDAFGAEARDALAAELAAVDHELATDAGPVADPLGEELLRHGLATAAVRARFRREALGRAIAPCLRALVAARPASMLAGQVDHAEPQRADHFA